MNDSGVYKAWDLLQKPEMWVRKVMGIHGIRMINELKGSASWNWMLLLPKNLLQ
jgi:hypothetical protein